MSRDTKNIEALSWVLICFSMVLSFMYIYWIIAPLLASYGIRVWFLEPVVLLYKDYFSHPFKVKGLAFVLIVCSTMCRSGKKVEASWKAIVAYCLIGTALYFIPVPDAIIHSLFIFQFLSSVLFVNILYSFQAISLGLELLNWGCIYNVKFYLE